MLARLASGLLLALVAACTTFDDALETAAVFGEASEIRECQDVYRASLDRWAFADCIDDKETSGLVQD